MEKLKILRKEVKIYFPCNIDLQQLTKELLLQGFKKENYKYTKLYTVYFTNFIKNGNDILNQGERLRFYINKNSSFTQSIRSKKIIVYYETKNSNLKERKKIKIDEALNLMSSWSNQLVFSKANRVSFIKQVDSLIQRITLDLKYTYGILIKDSNLFLEDIIYENNNIRTELKINYVSIPEKEILNIFAKFPKRLAKREEELLIAKNIISNKQRNMLVKHAEAGFTKEGFSNEDEIQKKFILDHKLISPNVFIKEIFELFKSGKMYPYVLSLVHGKRQNEVGKINYQFYTITYYQCSNSKISYGVITSITHPHLIALSIKKPSFDQSFFNSAICRIDGTKIMEREKGLQLLFQMLQYKDIIKVGTLIRKRFYFFFTNLFTNRNFWLSVDLSKNVFNHDKISQVEIEYKGRSGIKSLISKLLSAREIDKEFEQLTKILKNLYSNKIKCSNLDKVHWLLNNSQLIQ